MKTVRIYYDGRKCAQSYPYSIYFPENEEIRGQFVECCPVNDDPDSIYVGCWGEIRWNNDPAVLGRRAEKTAPKCIKDYAKNLADELGYKVAF